MIDESHICFQSTILQQKGPYWTKQGHNEIEIHR